MSSFHKNLFAVQLQKSAQQASKQIILLLLPYWQNPVFLKIPDYKLYACTNTRAYHLINKWPKGQETGISGHALAYKN